MSRVRAVVDHLLIVRSITLLVLVAGGIFGITHAILQGCSPTSPCGPSDLTSLLFGFGVATAAGLVVLPTPAMICLPVLATLWVLGGIGGVAIAPMLWVCSVAYFVLRRRWLRRQDHEIRAHLRPLPGISRSWRGVELGAMALLGALGASLVLVGVAGWITTAERNSMSRARSVQSTVTVTEFADHGVRKVLVDEPGLPPALWVWFRGETAPGQRIVLRVDPVDPTWTEEPSSPRNEWQFAIVAGLGIPLAATSIGYHVQAARRRGTSAGLPVVLIRDEHRMSVRQPGQVHRLTVVPLSYELRRLVPDAGVLYLGWLSGQLRRGGWAQIQVGDAAVALPEPLERFVLDPTPPVSSRPRRPRRPNRSRPRMRQLGDLAGGAGTVAGLALLPAVGIFLIVIGLLLNHEERVVARGDGISGTALVIEVDRAGKGGDHIRCRFTSDSGNLVADVSCPGGQPGQTITVVLPARDAAEAYWPNSNGHAGYITVAIGVVVLGPFLWPAITYAAGYAGAARGRRTR